MRRVWRCRFEVPFISFGLVRCVLFIYGPCHGLIEICEKFSGI